MPRRASQQFKFWVSHFFGMSSGILCNFLSCRLADHPWVKKDGEASDTPLDNAVLSRMKQFRAMNKLKKVALKV